MRFQELVIHGTGYSHYPLANIFIIMAFAKKYKNKCPLYIVDVFNVIFIQTTLLV